MAKGGRGRGNQANNQRSNSMNPNNPAYHASRNNHSNQFNPTSSAYKARMNNRANQMNPNNPAYYSSRQNHTGYVGGGGFSAVPQSAVVAPDPTILKLSKSTADKLNAIYRKLLQRAVDVDGARRFGTLLAKGEYTPRDVVREIAKSPEFFERFIKARPARQVIQQFYRKFLLRNPENQQVVEHHIQVVEEKGWEHLIDMFIDSEEYISRFGNDEPH